MAMTISTSLDYDQTAYEKLAYFALRPQLYFRQCADVKPTAQSMNGASVIFTIQSDLAVASATINESVDVTPVSLADSQVTVTLAEYGAAVQTSALIRGTSFIPLDPVVANVVGFNAGISLDTVVRDVLKGGSNVRYAGTGSARNTVVPTDTLKAANVRRAFAELQGANVPDFGGQYVSFIHPDVSYDLRGETGAAAWRDPHTYSQPNEIWTGEMGSFEGFRFIVTSRAPIFADAGSSTTLTDVYRTMFLGRQSLAEAWSSTDGNGPDPRIGPGPVTDSMRRFVPFAWYWLGGYNIFRQASLRAVESSSSIGTNS
jgi:N4-gp56 family major capsid protein